MTDNIDMRIKMPNSVGVNSRVQPGSVAAAQIEILPILLILLSR